MFFKCQYYLQFNYFGDETKKIIEPTADCYIAAHNMSKLDKSRIIGAIEKHKLLPGKKVEWQNEDNYCKSEKIRLEVNIVKDF